MKILVVGGHPADMFDHCGGTMYHHIQQGDEVVAVTAAQSVNFNEKHPAAHVAQVVFMLSTHDITPGVVSMIGKAAHPAYYVDVTDVMDLKVKAVTMMGSQKYDIEGYSKKRAEHWNGNFGVRVRLPYAEAFAFQWPEVGKTLPISDYRMWLANADEKDLLKNMSNLSAQDVEI